VYWAALDVTFGLVVCWALLNIFTAFRLDERCKKACLFELIGGIAYKTLPLLGNVCFVPLIYILMDVFICDQAVGYGSLGYTESLLARDCYVHCWDKAHTLYVVFASLSLLCYVPSAILLRPVWQDYQSNLHIRTYPTFFVAKSILQVVLICFSKTLKRWYPTAHAVLFLCAIVLFSLFSSLSKAYNYPRVNLWQTLSCAAVFVLSLIALLNDTVYDSPDFNLVFLVGILWFLLLGTLHIVSGLIYQALRLPCALYRKKSRDINTILRFAFTNSVPVTAVQPHLHLARLSDGLTCLSSQDFPGQQDRGRAVSRVPAAHRAVITTA